MRLEKIKSVMSFGLPFWLGVLLIYTFEMNSLTGFFVAIMLCRAEQLSEKDLLLAGLLIVLGGNYKFNEFIFNAAIGTTIFQAVRLFAKSEQVTRRNWLRAVLMSTLTFYTLRMTLIFDVPAPLLPIHELYAAATEYLRVNQNLMWLMSASLVAANAIIFLKTKAQRELPLTMGVLFGMCGLEDMTAIIVSSLVGQMVFKIGDDELSEYQKFVQEAGKVHKL